MRPVCTAEEMRAVDAEALAHVGIDELVERAGYALASEALRMLGGSYGRRIVVVAGKGHNGDDGRVAARVLARRGASVRVVPVAEAPSALPPCDLVVDAAFGTGFRGSYDAPTPPLGAFVLAADVPTGVDANTGRAGPRSVQADVTVTFGALKPGLLLGAGRRRAGEVVVRRIGLPVGNPPQHLVEDADLALLPARRPEGHKWDAAVYVAAGSPGMLGAAELATRGVARAGAGMVRLGSPGVAPGTVPVTEAVARHLPASDWAVPLLDDLSRCRALVLGPGLGSSSETVAAVRRLVVGAAVPLVLDADGLNALGTLDEAVRLLSARRAPLVMTPHDGEYARLVGTRPGEDRIAAAPRPGPARARDGAAEGLDDRRGVALGLGPARHLGLGSALDGRYRGRALRHHRRLPRPRGRPVARRRPRRPRPRARRYARSRRRARRRRPPSPRRRRAGRGRADAGAANG